MADLDCIWCFDASLTLAVSGDNYKFATYSESPRVVPYAAHACALGLSHADVWSERGLDVVIPWVDWFATIG